MPVPCPFREQCHWPSSPRLSRSRASSPAHRMHRANPIWLPVPTHRTPAPYVHCTDTCWPVSHHRARAWSETDVKRSPNPAYCSEDSPILLVTVASLPRHRSGRHPWGAARPPSPPAICCRRFSLKFAPHTDEISPMIRPPAWWTVGPGQWLRHSRCSRDTSRGAPGVTVPQRHWSLAPPDPPVDVGLEQHFTSRKVSEKQ